MVRPARRRVETLRPPAGGFRWRPGPAVRNAGGSRPRRVPPMRRPESRLQHALFLLMCAGSLLFSLDVPPRAGHLGFATSMLAGLAWMMSLYWPAGERRGTLYWL